jgi:hypothetical protein
MNAHVHYGLTKRWAIEQGFSEEDAETIARADVAVDRELSGREWRSKQYHFGWLGAKRRASDFFEQALEQHDLVALGRALHSAQDATSHGHLGHLWHWPGIDLWERRSDRARRKIELTSRRLLADYCDRQHKTACETV